MFDVYLMHQTFIFNNSIKTNQTNMATSQKNALTPELVKELEATYIVNFRDHNSFEVVKDYKDADVIYILGTHDNMMGIQKYIKLPKTKVIDMAWITSKIESDNVYVSFAKNFKKLLVDIYGIEDSLNCYPTTYGIGVSIFYNRSADETITLIRSVLVDNDIEFKTEISEGHLVWRFKISKSAKNISAMEAIKSKI